MKNAKKNGGFIALISAIVISALLLAITFSLSLSGYFSRFNTLSMEYKKRSNALAEACVDSALLDIANNAFVTATTVIPVGPYNCTLFPMQTSTATTTIKTQGIFQQVYTNLSVVANSTSATVISWNEIPHLP